MHHRTEFFALLLALTLVCVGFGSAGAKGTAKGKALNPLPKLEGSSVCQNASFPGFRGAEKSFNWKTTPQCHVFEKGKHLVCENFSGGVTYVESSTWNPQAKMITTRFFISHPYKNYDVTTYRWDKKTNTFVSETTDKGVVSRATRTYGPDGSSNFRYAAVEKGKEKLLLEITCQPQRTK